MTDGIFNSLSSALINFCISVINLLPDSPFAFLDTYQAPASVVMGYVNWFIDFGTMLSILQKWVLCVFAWYAYQIVLRWIKVIE